MAKKRKPITKEQIESTLRQHGGVAWKTIEALGISGAHYYRHIKKFGLQNYGQRLQKQGPNAASTIDLGVVPPDSSAAPKRVLDQLWEARAKSVAKKEPKTTAQLITEVCDELKTTLLEKNRAYGDSAISPVRIFSTADPIEQLRVRIDDKLSRIFRGKAAGEDVELDLMGYLVLLRVARKR